MALLQSNKASTKVIAPLNFGHNGLAASTTTGTIPILATGGGTLTAYEWTAPYDGSILFQTARLGAAPSAGTLTIQPRINGSLTAFTTQKHVNSSDIRAFVGKQGARIATSSFLAGDTIGLSYTTTSDWAADNTIAIDAQVYILLEGVRV
jgi:hypothetical protein